MRTPSSELLAGRRALDGMKGVEILEDWVWYKSVGQWALRCRLSIESGDTSLVPAETDWFVLADEQYPRGLVRFCPAVDGGLELTFLHQSYNSPGDGSVPWRSGQICSGQDPRLLGRYAYGSEPSEPNKRLRWYTKGALNWLSAAAHGDLAQPDDPFELPDLPGLDISKTVAFCEDGNTLSVWRNSADRAGVVDLSSIGSVYFTKKFYRANGSLLMPTKWGLGPASSNTSIRGIWIRLDEVPTLPVWQGPSTFGDLRRVIAQQGLNFDHLLQPTLHKLRDGKRHIVMIGFPIPSRHSGPPDRMHWQSLLLPLLSHGTKTRKGYRPKEKGYSLRDRRELLGDDVELQWLASENWDAEQLSTRGRLAEVLTGRNILLVGAGAFGASLAELLIRGGLRYLYVIDGDIMRGGNLARHTLTVNDINIAKASRLAERLNLVSPHASVQAINHLFPPSLPSDHAQCRACELIIDCTGDDEVLHELERFAWGGGRTFISLSFGFGARRLFCFASQSSSFPTELFQKAVQPWLELERERYANEQLPWEGIGCWHPVFPGRADDVWLLSAAAAKFVESVAAKPPDADAPIFRVFEQLEGDSAFAGLHLVH